MAKFGFCPYNIAHVVEWHQLPNHINKCQNGPRNKHDITQHKDKYDTILFEEIRNIPYCEQILYILKQAGDTALNQYQITDQMNFPRPQPETILSSCLDIFIKFLGLIDFTITSGLYTRNPKKDENHLIDLPTRNLPDETYVDKTIL
eukprot:UN33785